MADYLAGLLDAIGNQKKEYYATNPYIGAAQGIASYQPETSGLSPWQGFAIQALQGLGAGAAAGYGKKQADEQTRDFAQKYFGALGGADPIAAFMADRELSQYAPAAVAYKENQRAEIDSHLAKQGIRRAQDGSWQAVPGAREALQSLEGTGDPLLQEALYLTRAGKPLTEDHQKALAGAPLTVQKTADAISYRDSVQERYEDRKTFDSTLNRKLFEKQADAERFLTRKQLIDKTLESFDPNETIAGAFLRNVEAGAIRDSEAADLKRQIQEAAFAALKPTFPGALSDEERKAMMAVSGGEMTVPVSTIKKIFDRKESAILKDTNRDLNRAIEAGYQIQLSPLTSEPQNTALEAPTPTVDNQPRRQPPPGLTFEQFQAWKRGSR